MASIVFEERLREQASSALYVTERVLNGGEEVPESQRKTAIALISGALKAQAVSNGRVTQIISLTKLGIRDPDVRESIAREALRGILPAAVFASSGQVSSDKMIDSDDHSQPDEMGGTEGQLATTG